MDTDLCEEEPANESKVKLVRWNRRRSFFKASYVAKRMKMALSEWLLKEEAFDYSTMDWMQVPGKAILQNLNKLDLCTEKYVRYMREEDLNPSNRDYNLLKTLYHIYSVLIRSFIGAFPEGLVFAEYVDRKDMWLILIASVKLKITKLSDELSENEDLAAKHRVS